MHTINCKGHGCDATDETDLSYRNMEYHDWARSDWHGIFTGYYCDKCYQDNYPYRRDDYTEGTGICDDGTPIEPEEF